MFGIARRREARAAAERERQARMVSGHAVIVQIGGSVQQPGHDAVVLKVRLRVELPEREPYEVTCPWEVNVGALSGLTAGKRVPFRVDPQEPGRPWTAMGNATYSALYRHWEKGPAVAG